MRRALTWVGWCGERSDRAGAPAAAAQGSTAAQQTGVGPRFQYGLPPPAAVQLYRVKILGCRKRGRKRDGAFNHTTGKGYVAYCRG